MIRHAVPPSLLLAIAVGPLAVAQGPASPVMLGESEGPASLGRRLFWFPDLPASDPHQGVMANLQREMNQSCLICHNGMPPSRPGDLIGLSVVPADETLRAQLALGNRGLVVTAVAPGSVAASAGIKVDDVLVTIGTAPLATLDDLKSRLDASRSGAGGAIDRPDSVRINLLRDGDTLDLTVRRVETAPSAPAAAPARPSTPATGDDYWIGVSPAPATETLRKQIKLPAKVGLIVNDVVDKTPAAIAGLKKNDILLDLDGRALGSIEDLSRAVRSAGGKGGPVPVTLRRDGKPMTVSIQPARRASPPRVETPSLSVESGSTLSPTFTFYGPISTIRPIKPGENPYFAGSFDPATPVNAKKDRLEDRLESLDAQLRSLTAAIGELKAAIQSKAKD